MDIKGTIMRHEQLGLPFIEFNEEGGFMIKLSSSSEKGKYKLKGSTILLKPLYPKKPSQSLIITKLDDKELDYTSTDSSGIVKVVCYKITQGLEEKDKD